MRHLRIIKLWFITITCGDVAKALRLRAKLPDVTPAQFYRMQQAADLLDTED